MTPDILHSIPPIMIPLYIGLGLAVGCIMWAVNKMTGRYDKHREGNA